MSWAAKRAERPWCAASVLATTTACRRYPCPGGGRCPLPGHPADARQARAGVVQEGVDQGAALAAGRGMHRHAGRLVDHDQVGVLVEHSERDRLGHRLGGDGRRDFQPVVAGHRLARGVGDRRAVAADMPLGDQRLDPGPRHLRQQVGEHLVDPAASAFRPDRHDAHAKDVVFVDVRIGAGRIGNVRGQGCTARRSADPSDNEACFVLLPLGLGALGGLVPPHGANPEQR